MTARADMEDALNPRMAGSTEGMTLQVLAQIRDNLTAMSRDIRTNNEATAEVRDRVIRLEERDRRLTDAEADLKVLDAKVGVLMKDKDRRDGAIGVIGGLRTWGPAIFSLFTMLYLMGRAVGIIPSPPTTVTKIDTPVRLQATGNPENEHIEGAVGGRP